MSSISAKISVIPKMSADKIPELLESIVRTMKTDKLSKKEMDQLCQTTLTMLPNSPPIVSRAILSTMKEIIDSHEYSSNYPKQLLLTLMPILGIKKIKVRNLAINLAYNLVPLVTPTFFWEQLSPALNDKNNYLKESALILFKETVKNFPDFKTSRYLKAVFSSFKDPQPIPRQDAMEIATILYQKNPTAIETQLKNQFSIDSNKIISQLKNELPPQPTQSSTASYSNAQNVPQIKSTEEITENLIKEFHELCPDVLPDPSPCPFKELGAKLKRSADYQDRMEGLKTLIAHARGTQKPDVFLRDLRIVQDQFTGCLVDLRSALTKYAMLTLVSFAKVFGAQIDQFSEWLIQPVLPRTTCGTLVIAKSSEIAIIKYVQYVQGKHIKNILLQNYISMATQVRLTVTRAIIVANKYWGPNLTRDFDDILNKLAHDKSLEVRNEASGKSNVNYIIEDEQPPASTFKSNIPQKSRKLRLTDTPRPETVEIEEEEEPEEEMNGNLEEIEEDNADNNLETLEIEEEETPEESPNNEIENNGNEVQEDQIETDETNAIIKQLYDNKDTKGFVTFIRERNPTLLGYMQEIIDMIVMDLNDEQGIENAIELLQLVCEKYVKLLYPFISQLILDLPQDREHGIQCLTFLASAIGELHLAKLLKQSKLPYANEFILNVAEKMPTDIDFQSSAVLNLISHQQYSDNKQRIIKIIEHINSVSPIKCESLFMLIPMNTREAILAEFRSLLPNIYQAFVNNKQSDMPNKLAREIEKAKKGESIDFDLIQEVPKTDLSLLILAIATLRESPDYNQQFVDYLISLTENNKDAILGSVRVALQQKYESNPNYCLDLANCFIPSNTVFNSFARSIQYADKNTIEEALSIIKDYMIDGLTKLQTKYAVLSILANACVYLGEEYQTFCGELEQTNQKLLSNMIQKIQTTEE